MQNDTDNDRLQSLKRLALHYRDKGDNIKAEEYASRYLLEFPDDREIRSIIEKRTGNQGTVAEGVSSNEYSINKQNAQNHLTNSDSASESSAFRPPDKRYRVLFYIFKNVHAPMLLPVYEAMKDIPEFEIAFSVVDAIDNRAFSRFMPNEVEELKKLPVQFVDSPADWHPDVTLVADNVAFMLEGCGKIVNIGHGLLSKGQYFTDSSFTARENLEDLLCVPGYYHKQQLEASGKVFIPIVATGYPKMDILFRSDTLGRDELMRKIGLDPAKKVVLYAPTFNVALSSIPILWMRVRHLANENTYLLIKLHGSTLIQFKEHYLALSEKHENILYIADMNLAPYMKIADVMVSDVSSAFMEFICLDKPVVLFNNPNCEDYINYNPKDIEYAWRDVGLQADTLEELISAVNRSLANPGELSEKRRYYADKLMAARDGNSARRVVQAVIEMLANRLENPLDGEPATGVLIPVTGNSKGELLQTLEAVLEHGGEKIQTLVHGSITSDLRTELSDRWPGKIIFTQTSADILGMVNGSKYLVYVKPGMKAKEKWLFRLVNHLRQDSRLEGVFPMGLGGTPAQNPLKYLKLPDERCGDAMSMDGEIRYAGVGKHLVPVSEIPPTDLWAVRLGTPSGDLLLNSMNGDGFQPPFSRMNKTGMAMDLVVQY